MFSLEMRNFTRFALLFAQSPFLFTLIHFLKETVCDPPTRIKTDTTTTMRAQVQQLYTRYCPRRQTPNSPRECIVMVMKTAKTKDYALKDVLRSLSLPQYCDKVDRLLKCFDMEKNVVANYLVDEVRFQQVHANTFVKLVWYDRMEEYL